MQDTSILYDFAKQFPSCYTPYIGDGYIRYDTHVPEKIAAEINYWAGINGFDVKASRVNHNQVIVELREAPLTYVIEQLEELKTKLK